MALDERSRNLLHQRLQEVLGTEEAAILMEHLPPGGFAQLATKDDLRAVQEQLGLKMDALSHELLGEIHKTARTLTLSLTTIMAVLNGIVFTALKLG
jgi:hypothetical protein